MSAHFGPTSTADQVLEGIDLRGTRILVTGTSAGLGVETARALVAHGAQVVGAVRDLVKAQRATEQVRAHVAEGGSYAHCIFIINESVFQVEAVNTAYTARISAAMIDHKTRDLVSAIR